MNGCAYARLSAFWHRYAARNDKPPRKCYSVFTNRFAHQSFTIFEKECIFMKLSDLIIDPASLGKRFWLVDVIPSYAYQNGQRTDTVTGYRYTVALPDKGLDKINVRIDGDQQMDAPASFVEVRFDGLEPYLYWSGGEYQLGARAKGISAVNTGKG